MCCMLKIQQAIYKDLIHEIAEMSTKVIRKVCRDIGEDWKQLARILGLEGLEKSDATIQNIEKQGRTLAEQARLMLMQWKQEKSKSATYASLLKALKECERNDIAGECKQINTINVYRRHMYIKLINTRDCYWFVLVS